MNSQQLEDNIGIEKSFRLMNLWREAVQISSGNRFTTRPMPTTEEVFKILCHRWGFNNSQIRMYLSLED
jgi:hypothetical protein